MKSTDKNEIYEKAHLPESTDMAREYYKGNGLTFENLTKSNLYKLSEFIQQEIDILLADKTYNMIRKLQMHSKIHSGVGGWALYTNGYYFKKRQAISFEPNGWIGFCGWASGCNRIPYVKGFIKWCDYMAQTKQQEVYC